MAKLSRKRQSRLAFTPIPSSSPAAKDYNKQIQDRAAAVVVEGSPSKRRKLRKIVVEGEESNSAIPTPPDEDEGEDSDNKPLRPSQRRSRAKQQRLDWSSARDPSSFGSPVKLTSSSRKPKASKGNGIFSSQAQGQIIDSDTEESDASDVVPPSQRKRKSATKSKSPEERGRRTRSSMPTNEEDEESDEIAVGIAKPVRQNVVESEDEEDEMPTTLGTQRRQRKKRASSRSSFIDDSSPPPALSKTPRGRKRAREPSSSPPDSPPAAIDSDDDLMIIHDPRKKRRRLDSSDEEEEDDAPKTPRRRLLKKKPRQITREEENDLAEDLEFLKPSSDEDRPARSTQSPKKTKQQKALEALKQKRGTQSSQPIPIDEDDEEPEEDDEEEMIDDDDEVEEVEAPTYTSRRDMFREDDEDADFIEEGDEDDPLGIPDGVPIEFTRYASMKAKELFRWAVEWFVQRKINPAFARDDQIYNLTFKKLDDEIQGLSNSKFTSSAWVPEFVIALQARPLICWDRIDRSDLDMMFVDKCQACNRSGHPPTYRIQFQGIPYHRETLDEVVQEEDEDDSDSDSEDNSQKVDRAEKTEYDVQGREVKPEVHQFLLGKFCKANTVSAHSLYHWRAHLAAYVEEWLGQQGYLTKEQLAKRDKQSTAKRGKRANKIVDKMEKLGVIRDLWQRFREKIDDARNAKQGGRHYGGDSD